MRKVVVCRSVADFTRCRHVIPENVLTGFECAACKEALTLGPMGQKMLTLGEATLLCTPCGTKLAKGKIRESTLAGIVISPKARETLQRFLAAFTLG